MFERKTDKVNDAEADKFKPIIKVAHTRHKGCATFL
jgi:hypothetical protein